MSQNISSKYPVFRADQVLTAEHLNDLFKYLDAGSRRTRSHLVGIGIVCGLEVRPGAASVTITKGCGVTSEGYLIHLDEDITYTRVKEYVPPEKDKYEPFLAENRPTGAPAIQVLMEAAVGDGVPLAGADLADMVVVMFVELTVDPAKNCTPTSCDDKGATVEVEFLPLLMSKGEALRLSGGDRVLRLGPSSLPMLRMPRFDVPATPLADSEAIFTGYRGMLNATFLTRVQQGLSRAYAAFRPVVGDEYPANPFASFASDFSFLHNTKLEAAQLLAYQYYYDLFGDVVLAYEELRQAGEELPAGCCPSPDLFPRHLMLGEAAVATGGGEDISFRQVFMPSAAVGSGKEVDTVRTLFRRMVLMTQRFAIPSTARSFIRTATVGPGIRITPSRWGSAPLSHRAIPFYYEVAGDAPQLFRQWSAERARTGRAVQTLSFHAARYTADDAVINPLDYDLESYDFLRIEGHVGQPFARALEAIQQERDNQRLPFDVVALSADLRSARTVLQRNVLKAALPAGYKLNLAALSGGLKTPSLAGAAIGTSIAASSTTASTQETGAQDDGCYVQDLEALYDAQRAEFNALLCAEMQYFYGMNLPALQKKTPPALKTAVPTVPLLATCAPAFRIRTGSLGQFFEGIWSQWKDRDYTAPDTFLALIGSKRFTLAASALGAILGTAAGTAYKTPGEFVEELPTNPVSREAGGADPNDGGPDRGSTVMVEPTVMLNALKTSGSKSFSPGGTGIGTGINLSAIGAGIGTSLPSTGITFPGIGGIGNIPFNPSTPSTPFNPNLFPGGILNPGNLFPGGIYNPPKTLPGGIFIPPIQLPPVPPVTPTIRDKDSRSVLLAYLLLYYIQKLSEALPASLSAFSAETFGERYAHLMEVADEVKDLIAAEEEEDGAGKDTYAASSFAAEDIIDHLDSLLYASKDAAFGAVADAYDDRKSEAALLQSFGYFAQQHPGIAHKGGVPMGGTFILVYHQAATEEDEAGTTLIRDIVLADPSILSTNLTNIRSKQRMSAEALSIPSNLANFERTASGLTSPQKEIVSKTSVLAEVKNVAARITPTEGMTDSAPSRPNTILSIEPDVLNLRDRITSVGLPKTGLGATSGLPATNFLNAALSGILKGRVETDDTIATLLEDVADGTVIADFFLPYRCTSNCPPMQFVVNAGNIEEPQGGAPTIKLPTTRYCSDDAGEYPITARPGGGQLEGEGVDAEAKVFRPSEVDLAGAQASKEVTITYTTPAGAGSVKVTVDAVPRAAFRMEDTDRDPLTKTFTDLSTHAQSHAWAFGDGGSSTNKAPQHTYKQPGTYTVSLEVANGLCSATTSEEITVGKVDSGNNEEPARKCVPLTKIIAAYDDYVKKLGTRLLVVTRDLPDVAAMSEFFEFLKKTAAAEKKKQIEAFDQKKLTAVIERLLEALHGLIMEGKQRPVAMTFYRLLMQVALYLGCMQDEDLDRAAVPISGVLKTLNAHAGKWTGSHAQWKSTEKKALADLGELLQAEATRLKNAGDKEPKRDYLEALNKRNDLLKPPSA